jgi:hypothetical protein
MRKKHPKPGRFTRTDFDRAFPDDGACLDWLFAVNNPDYANGIPCNSDKCEGKVRKHYRDAQRLSYSCDMCGNHVHPMAGTIYEKSSTPLRKWFLAIYLMATTKTGVSSRWLGREIGVTVKTSWRMFTQIRSMLDEGEPLLGGGGRRVEIDETIVGGYRRRDKNPEATSQSFSACMSAADACTPKSYRTRKSALSRRALTATLSGARRSSPTSCCRTECSATRATRSITP